MTKFHEKFFCPAPWTNMYYQINSPSPCHIIRNNNLNMTPQEYVNSDWLKEIKTDMVEGRVPKACHGCKEKEDLGLKSTRGAVWGWYNIGPEPEYEKMWFADKLHVDTPTLPKRLEFRFSNLCNFKCRMCDETSSSEWALEKKIFKIKPNAKNNPDGIIINTDADHVLNITDDKVEGLKDPEFLKNLEHVCFTGGEPFVIKKYYEYLDFLIENGFHKKNFKIEIFTNCSVYNPIMIERLSKFSSVEFVMSIDGVGKTAEYIRKGTNWESVEKNVIKFVNLKHPFSPIISTATSAYTLLDVANLAKFMIKLSEINSSVSFKGYSVMHDGVGFHAAPNHLLIKMIEQIDQAVEILNVDNFRIYKNELKNIKKQILSILDNTYKPITTRTNDKQIFFNYTARFDKIRKESFEETFGIPLYP